MQQKWILIYGQESQITKMATIESQIKIDRQWDTNFPLQVYIFEGGEPITMLYYVNGAFKATNDKVVIQMRKLESKNKATCLRLGELHTKFPT